MKGAPSQGSRGRAEARGTADITLGRERGGVER